MQAECHSYVLEKAVEVDRSVIGVFVEFAEIVFHLGQMALIEFEVALRDLQFLDLGIKS
jgi:hypothetical protein